MRKKILFLSILFLVFSAGFLFVNINTVDAVNKAEWVCVTTNGSDRDGYPKVTVEWDEFQDVNFEDIVSYRLTRNGTELGIINAPENFYEDNDVLHNTYYLYQIYPITAEGEQPNSVVSVNATTGSCVAVTSISKDNLNTIYIGNSVDHSFTVTFIWDTTGGESYSFGLYKNDTLVQGVGGGDIRSPISEEFNRFSTSGTYQVCATANLHENNPDPSSILTDTECIDVEVSDNLPAPSINLEVKESGTSSYADSVTIDFGDTADAEWSASNVFEDSCKQYDDSDNGEWFTFPDYRSVDEKGTDSNISFSLAGDYNLTIACADKSGSYTDSSGNPYLDSASVMVQSSEPAPEVTLTANPTNVAYGGSSTLTWTVSNADSCEASGDWSGLKSASGGSESTGSINSSETYTLTCTGDGGGDSDSATVTVGNQVNLKAMIPLLYTRIDGVVEDDYSGGLNDDGDYVGVLNYPDGGVFTADIKNNGGANAGPSRASIRFGSSGSTPEWSTSYFYSDTSSLNVSASTTVSFDTANLCYFVDGEESCHHLSTFLSGGGRDKFEICADAYNDDYQDSNSAEPAAVIDESIETEEDNCVVGYFTTESSVNPYKDLIPQNLEITPANPEAGESIKVSVKVKNQGDQAVPGNGWRVRMQIFQDDGSVATVTKHSSVSQSLAAGGIITKQWNNVWDAPEGTHRVEIYVDPFNVVNESNESNNDLETAVTATDSETLTLSVDLEAKQEGTNWSQSLEGDEPFNGIDFKATVSGTTTGDIDYYFYCDRDDEGTSIVSGYNLEVLDQGTPYNAENLCDYSTEGSYTGKVVVKREDLFAEDRVPITVNSSEGGNSPYTSNRDETMGDACLSPLQPTLSWTFNDDDGDDQDAYRIQVATSPSFNSGSIEVDTGRVESSSNAYTVPTGNLEFNTTYYWRIMVWDDAGLDSGWENIPSQDKFTTQEHAAPDPDFSWSPIEPVVDEDVSFTDESSVFGGDSITDWSWSFQSGNPGSSSDQNPITVFTSDGTKRVTLEVSDSLYTCDINKDIEINAMTPDIKEVTP